MINKFVSGPSKITWDISKEIKQLRQGLKNDGENLSIMLRLAEAYYQRAKTQSRAEAAQSYTLAQQYFIRVEAMPLNDQKSKLVISANIAVIKAKLGDLSGGVQKMQAVLSNYIPKEGKDNGYATTLVNYADMLARLNETDPQVRNLYAQALMYVDKNDTASLLLKMVRKQIGAADFAGAEATMRLLWQEHVQNKSVDLQLIYKLEMLHFSISINKKDYVEAKNILNNLNLLLAFHDKPYPELTMVSEQEHNIRYYQWFVRLMDYYLAELTGQRQSDKEMAFFESFEVLPKMLVNGILVEPTYSYANRMLISNLFGADADNEYLQKAIDSYIWLSRLHGLSLALPMNLRIAYLKKGDMEAADRIEQLIMNMIGAAIECAMLDTVSGYQQSIDMSLLNY